MTDRPEAVAVVGMSCRFPGAHNSNRFWRNLREGVESIRFFTKQELREAGVDPSLLENPSYVRARGTLERIGEFDAGFFGFSPREAELTDPQHRIFLEICWEALENAGIDPQRYDGAIGVFGGAGVNTYLLNNLYPRRAVAESQLQTSLQNKTDHLTTRIAYKLNLSGPAVTVQTACSTSLVAVCLACQSLLTYQCDAALAGGVTITVPQRSGYLHEKGGILSPDGHCRAFDAQAAGTVDGSGAGVVALKRLGEALAAGDPVHAVIRGFAVNNDGSDKAGYTAPSVARQAEAIALAQEMAGVDPGDISYVEAHGTGTPLGDPIEVAALTQAFRRSVSKTGFCGLGSVKTNVGHLDAAAGIAGLIKTILSLRHRQIPPSLHFRRPNREIDFAASPFFVVDKPIDWKSNDRPRRAGVSSFGIGGTNAHVILEEAPAAKHGDAGRAWQVLLLSAQSAPALERATENLAEFLTASPDLNLPDAAYTLQTGRKTFRHRRAALCRDREDAAAALRSLHPERVATRLQDKDTRPVFFMFPGQGSQYAGMTGGLYRQEPFFRQELDRCVSLIQPHLDFDLKTLLYPDDERREWADRQLERTEAAQPALFVVEYALARLWMHWGIRPQATIGHSLGEYVAACLAGVLTLEQALELVALRGRAMGSLEGGAMSAVALPEEEIREFLQPPLSLAAVNGPSLAVVAGPTAAVESLERRLGEKSVVCRRLHTSHAFHSPMMAGAVPTLKDALGGLQAKPPQIPYLSNLTGDWIQAEDLADPDYWIKHLLNTVRFSEGVSRLLEQPNAALLEVGPGRTLKTIARWHHTKSPDQVIETSLPDRGQDLPDLAAMLGAAGRLWTADVQIDWSRFYEGERRRRIALPTYPFQRRRYWVDPVGETAPRAAETDLSRLENWFYRPRWEESAALPPASSLVETRSRWLILADGLGLGQCLANRLNELGHAAATATPANEFGQSENGAFHLNPRRQADYRRLIEKLLDGNGIPERIVHLWTLTPEDDDGTVEEALAMGFESLLFLAQALGRLESLPEVEISLVANRLHPVHGNESVAPAKAIALGPCRVIPREHSSIRCRSVDVVLPSRPERAEFLAEQLLSEILAGETGGSTALRGRQRWKLRYSRTPLADKPGPVPVLRKQGVYLITGGLGGIGLEIAGWLARAVQARLVLAGRSEFPARDRWESWLRERPNDPIGQKIRTLQKIEREGAEVWPIRADVTSESELNTLVGRIKQRWDGLHGVVHAAGVAGGGLVQLADLQSAQAVLAPKIQGTLALESALQHERLDFLALFSSLASIVGRPGQVAYSSANAFLDAFAQSRGCRGDRVIFSINWGEWQNVGMAAQSLFASRSRPSPQSLGHPFLETRRSGEAGAEIFTTDFTVDRHWVLDEHRLVGHPVVPGVAFIEMVRAALEGRIGDGALQLEDVFFVAPLRVPEDRALPVRLTLEPQNGGWMFTVEGDAPDDGASETQIYAQGRAAIVEPKVPEHFRLSELKQRCSLRREIFSEEEREEDLGPRWQNVKIGHIGEDQVLTELELPPRFASDFDRIGYHPALMDRATGRAQEYLVEGVYMPVSYRKLHIHSPIGPRIFSYSRYQPALDPTRETLTFDTWVMDETGRALVQIEGFTQKRINDAAEAIKSFSVRRTAEDEPLFWSEAEPAQSPREPADSDSAAMTVQQGLEAFRRVLLHQPGPQVAVSTRDLEDEIELADQRARQKVLATSAPDADVSKPMEASAQGKAHPRPELKTEFAPPRDDAERLIAQAWSESLRIDRIGVHDNFFELGGDSVQAIQIIAKLNRRGVELSPQQFFQHQTVAQLAKTVGEARTEEEPAPRPERSGAERAEQPWTIGRDQLERLSAQIEEADASQDSDEEPVRAGVPDDVEVGSDASDVIAEALLRHPAVLEAVCTRGETGWTAHLSVDAGREPFWQAMDFSLFYFADDSSSARRDKYQLYIEGARFADRHDLSAVWTPERHFHNNGGLYPNPSVLSAALATVTSRVGLRAGSVVLPLHDPLRVAEEWSVVDNLSGGRVGVSFTSGWIPKDFALRPDAYAEKRLEMEQSMQVVQRLWRGDSVEVRDGAGNPTQVEIFPKPIQTELPIWLTCSGDPAMFVKAGELGVNVLTALLAQTPDEAAEKIALYRDARRRSGHPGPGQVTMMLHAFLGDEEEAVRRTVRDPLCEYLKSHVGLIETMAESLKVKVDVDSRQWMDQLVSFAFERYYETASLLGTPGRCLEMAKRMREMGVDEIACLIDFGVPARQVLDHLPHLLELRELCGAQTDRLTKSLRLHADRHLPAPLRPSRFLFHESLEDLAAAGTGKNEWKKNSA